MSDIIKHSNKGTFELHSIFYYVLDLYWPHCCSSPSNYSFNENMTIQILPVNNVVWCTIFAVEKTLEIFKKPWVINGLLLFI